MLALCAATANAVYQLLSRMLASTERTMTLLFYTALVGALCFGVSLPWFWTGALPPATHLALFCCTGLLGGVGHFLFTAAHRRSEEHTSELQSLMRISYAVFCLKKTTKFLKQ